MKNRISVIAILSVAASFGAAAPGAAQSFTLPATPARGVWLEGTYADLKGFRTDLPSSVWYLSGRAPVTARVSAVIDVPFSYAKAEFDELGSSSSTVLGNPYLGVEYSASPRLVLDLGARAPIGTSDDESFADVVAVIADPHHAESFMQNTVPVSAGAVYTLPFANGLALKTRAGVTGLFHTDDESSDPDAVVDYGVAGSWAPGSARIALSFAGRWFATSDQDNFGEGSLHYAGLSADLLVGGVRPGVSLRLPLDRDYREFVSSAIGVYLQVPLR